MLLSKSLLPSPEHPLEALPAGVELSAVDGGAGDRRVGQEGVGMPLPMGLSEEPLGFLEEGPRFVPETLAPPLVP